MTRTQIPQVIILGLVAALACGGGSPGPTMPPSPPPAPTPPTLVGVKISPAQVTLTPGSQQQFNADASYSDGTRKTIPAVWAANGGVITSTGLFTAGPTSGGFVVTASDGASGQSDSGEVVIVAQPPTGPYVAWLKRDWSVVPDKPAAQALGFGVEGSPAQCAVSPDATWDLLPDPLWGKIVRYFGDPGFNAPGFTVGCTAVHGTSLTTAPRLAWVRQFVRFSAQWTPLPGVGYKLMFLRFEVSGRQQIEVTATAFRNKTEAALAGTFVVRDPPADCGGLSLPGDRGIPLGMFRLTWDCRSQKDGDYPGREEWWEFVMGYLPNGGTLTSAWGYRRYTEGGAVNPGPWTVDVRQSSGGPWPALHRYEMGVNRNGIYQDKMHVDWGPYEIVDGARYTNPFGLPGLPPL